VRDKITTIDNQAASTKASTQRLRGRIAQTAVPSVSCHINSAIQLFKMNAHLNDFPPSCKLIIELVL
jgi:hypothetical protein